jgi:hypothetical protein
MATRTEGTSVNEFELRVQTGDGQVVPADDMVMQELKPVDGGIAAWTVLITAFVFEAILWGLYDL